jgi:hypothetical protein
MIIDLNVPCPHCNICYYKQILSTNCWVNHPQLQSLGEFKWPHKYVNILNYGSSLSFAMSNPQSLDVLGGHRLAWILFLC